MEDNIDLRHLLQHHPKGRHKLRGQLLDEADGIGEEDVPPPWQLDAARGGVQRGEELVGDEHVGAGQGIEQGRFAGVGVADDAHYRQARPPPLPTMHLPLLAHFL